MSNLAGFPSAEIMYDSDGGVSGTDRDVLSLAADPAVTDLLVLTHGWNSDAAAARQLFADLAASLRAVLDQGVLPALANRRLAIAGLIWPSKQFDNLMLVPSGTPVTAAPTGEQHVRAGLDALRQVFPVSSAQRELDAATALVPSLPDNPGAQDAFVDHLRSLVASVPAPTVGASAFRTEPGQVLIRRLSVPIPLAAPHVRSAAGYLELTGGTFAAATNLLNYLTFYEMKNRSGTVGEHGLAPLISKIRASRPTVRLHLAGHSFGARLISAAARVVPSGPPDPIASMTLLQAAFSEYGFADDWDPDQAGAQVGYFRADITGHKFSGPMLITYTANDLVLGIAYSIASRLAGQVASLVGDATDRYGALGRNGALRTPEAVAGALLAVGGTYPWQPGRPHNLLADAYIANHSDVTGVQVAYAILSAISAS